MDGMKRSAGLTLAILTLALARHASAQAAIVDHTSVALFDQIASTPRPSIDVYDLADYRLTSDVFDQFVQASGRVADITSHDAAFRYAPLFTKEVAVSGDAPAMASGLVARLENHAGLSAALQSANITPREYAKFAISLVAAHMAHQFITAGVLKRVPEGAPTINVEFVKSHQSEVAAVLAQLGIQD